MERERAGVCLQERESEVSGTQQENKHPFRQYLWAESGTKLVVFSL